MVKYQTTRDITVEECQWLEETIKKGTEIYEYPFYTYGCISSSGIAVSMVEGQTPFFELPYNSLIEIEKG